MLLWNKEEMRRGFGEFIAKDDDRTILVEDFGRYLLIADAAKKALLLHGAFYGRRLRQLFQQRLSRDFPPVSDLCVPLLEAELSIILLRRGRLSGFGCSEELPEPASERIEQMPRLCAFSLLSRFEDGCPIEGSRRVLGKKEVVL